MSEQAHTPGLIYDDPRPIQAIWYPGEDAGGYSIDTGWGADRIVAYKEHGQGDYVPYFAVYASGEIIARVPASLVTVIYARATPSNSGGK